jgi:UDP-glucuronate 4-epimerase
MMRILITGTAGFIGNNLALRMLKQGHEVAGVDAVTDYYDVQLKRDRLKRLKGYEKFSSHEYMLEDFDKLSTSFRQFKPEKVVHLAAQAGVRYSLENPRAYVDTNITGSFNVTELSKQHGVEHVVIASTSSAYGANNAFPFNEIDRAAFPLTIYAATKQSSELIAHSHSHLFNIPTTVVRFFSVYGPWGRPDMALFLFTKAMFENRSIDVYNHGRMIRDFTYVDDLTKSIELLVDTPPVKGQPVSQGDSLSPVAPYRLVNIGNANPVSLKDFINEIEKNIGVKAEMNMMGMQPGDVTKTFANSDLLEALTGYRPKGNIKDGVKAFVDWYREYYKVGLN